MFLIDTSPPMGTFKTVELPGPNGEMISTTVTHLEYVLQFVKLKVQEMVCCIPGQRQFISRPSTSDLQWTQDRPVWCNHIWFSRCFRRSSAPWCALIALSETDNIVHHSNGGYHNVEDYISISQPNANTLAKLDELRPSSISGDGKLNSVYS